MPIILYIDDSVMACLKIIGCRIQWTELVVIVQVGIEDVI
jgi:hypothetical protein